MARVLKKECSGSNALKYQEFQVEGTLALARVTIMVKQTKEQIRMRRLFWLFPISLAVAGILFVLGINPTQAADRVQVNTTTEASGVSYITLRPGISGTVELVALRLNNDGSATLTTDSNESDQAPVTESGVWSESRQSVSGSLPPTRIALSSKTPAFGMRPDRPLRDPDSARQKPSPIPSPLCLRH